MQAVTAWFEKAVPFGTLLAIIFLRQHIVGERLFSDSVSCTTLQSSQINFNTGCCTGIIVIVYLTSLIHKFNGVMRKEVALKEECSRWVCWAHLLALPPFRPQEHFSSSISRSSG